MRTFLFIFFLLSNPILILAQETFVLIGSERICNFDQEYSYETHYDGAESSCIVQSWSWSTYPSNAVDTIIVNFSGDYDSYVDINWNESIVGQQQVKLIVEVIYTSDGSGQCNLSNELKEISIYSSPLPIAVNGQINGSNLITSENIVDFSLSASSMENVNAILWKLDGIPVYTGLSGYSKSFTYENNRSYLLEATLVNICGDQGETFFHNFEVNIPPPIYEICDQNVFSDTVIILPEPPLQDGIIRAGCEVHFLTRDSILINSGMVIETGANVRFLLNPGAIADPSEDLDKNWVMETLYDGDGNVIGQSKSFSDALGRPTQFQVKNFSENHVLASHKIIDCFGNVALSTLSAPIFNTSFNFKEGFVTNFTGEDYSYSDFDLDINNPNPVGTEFGTLGWYYSHQNDIEPFTPISSFPYSRSWSEASPDPSINRSAGPGDQYHLGSGNESKTEKIRINDDPLLQKYYSWRANYVSSQISLVNTDEGHKIITTNQDDKESVTYIDASGSPIISGVKIGMNYEYSFTYFDDMGNMVAELAPEAIAQDNPTIFVNRYTYNYEGWLLSAEIIDEGKSEFVYNKDGKIRFSQNDQQKLENKFSYTNYDRSGRLIESGIYTMNGTNPYLFENHIDAGTAAKSIHLLVDESGTSGTLDTGRCSEVSKIMYDLPDANCPDTQHFLYNNISKTENENSTTWYSYDYQGRLEWTIQDIPGLGTKKVAYTYDFIGNVIQVAYEAGNDDAFYHHYEYDADQRLSKVYTSTDGIDRVLQANYEYYLHGPLKRVELATDLQGIDYLYTIQGSLKSINHGDKDKDPGLDGILGENQGFQADAFGMSLLYHDQDYVGAGYNFGEYSVPGTENSYSGNIKALSWHNANESHEQIMYEYQYDEKNQLVDANWGEITRAGNNYSFAEQLNKYAVSMPSGYDKHGNIQSLIRKDKDGSDIADYSYQYKTNSNQLNHITHNGSAFLDYDYNQVGQMIRQEETGWGEMHLVYDAYGMVKEVYADAAHSLPIVIFAYDDRGNRLLKKSYDEYGNMTLDTWYVRDAAGNVLSIYTQNYTEGTTLAQTEVPVYGASRLGVYLANENNYLYEVNDHLGNVRTVLIDDHTTLVFEATMESESATQEEAEFVNIAETRHQDQLNNHTTGGDHAAWLNASQGRTTGPGIGLKVNPGDKITLETFVKFNGTVSGNNNVISGLAAAIAGAFGYTGTMETQPIYELFDQALGGGSLLAHQDDNIPKAYIMGLVFDNDFVFQGDFMFQKVSSAAEQAWEHLMIEKEFDNAGYIYIFTASESQTNLDIFFDDIKVTHDLSPIASGNDFYPFGMAIADRSYQREKYRFDYQGQFSEKDEETGWNAFHLRQYDARIGRWISPDPYGQYASAYVGMGNNPVSGVDPDGGWANWSGLAKGVVIGAGIGAIGGAAYALSNDKEGWGWYALIGGVAGGLAGGGIGELLDNTVKPGNTRFRTTRDHMYKKFKGGGWDAPRKGIPKPPSLDRYVPLIGQTITIAKELLEPPERREVPQEEDHSFDRERKYDEFFEKHPLSGFFSSGLTEDDFWEYVSIYTGHAVDQAISEQNRGYDYIEVTLDVGSLNLDPVDVLQKVHHQFDHLPYMFESNEWYKIKNSGSQKLIFRFYKY